MDRLRSVRSPEPASRSPVNVLVTPNPEPQNEPAVAVHLLRPEIMVAAANDYRASGGQTSQIGIYRSTDQGRHWSNSIAPLPRGHRASGDPVVCYGYPDLFLVGGAAYKGQDLEGGGSIIVYRSENGGATFSGPVMIQEGFSEKSFNDKPWFAVDTAPASPYRGRAYVIYTRFMNPGTIIFFQRSADGGRTWSDPVALTGIEPFSLGTFVAVGRRGEVYLAWMADDEEAVSTSLFFRRSRDGGLTFDPPVTIATFRRPEIEEGLAGFVPEFTFRVYTFAFLGTDQRAGAEGGRIYAVWNQLRRRHGHHRCPMTVDVMVSVSDDRGCTWSRPRKATDSPSGALSFYPFVSVSPETGSVNIVYYTNRRVRNRLDLFLARADGQTRRFRPDKRVTSRSFDPNRDPLGKAFIGDYIGCAARPDVDRTIAVWCDTRRSDEDIFAAPDA